MDSSHLPRLSKLSWIVERQQRDKECSAIRRQGNPWKQQVKNERIKPLISYGDGKSSSKLEKAPTPPVPLSSMEGTLFRVRWISTDLGVSQYWGSPNKGSSTEARGGSRVKARRGEVLVTESEWGKVSSRLPLPTASPGCIKRLGGGARIRLLSSPQRT